MLSVEIKGMRMVTGDKPLKAFVDVLLGGEVLVKGLRVVNGQKGLFVSMPQMKSNKDGKWYSIVQVADNDLFRGIQDEVLNEYETKGGAGSRQEQEAPEVAPDNPEDF